MSKSVKTYLKTAAKDYKSRSVNPPVVRASTILFKTMQELRKHQKDIEKKKDVEHWDYGRQGTQTTVHLQKVIKGYDLFLNKKCPYIMGLHAAPKLDDNTFHFHIEFYPPLRSGEKPKILAGSESMAGVFIMDVFPEETAIELRKFMS